MSAIWNRNSGRRGMNLVEISIVLVVLGVVFAGVFMFFTRGTEHFHFSRRQNELATTGRMAVERVSDVLMWAGYMPDGGWSNDDWHPIELAQDVTLEFYADWIPANKTLDLTDYRQIDLLNGRIRIQDRAGNTELVGEFISDIGYTYRDATGAVLVPPLTIDERDLIRHVGIDLTLSSEYGGHVYQTVMHTTVSPRNLGVNHDINPAFLPPPPMYGNVVFNVNGLAGPSPTGDEQDMIDFCYTAGLTVFMVTDDSLAAFDYWGNSIDLLILRHLDEAFSHGANADFLDSLSVPTIVLGARDAVEIYGMGSDFQMFNTIVTMNPYNTNHELNKSPFNTTWTVYDMPVEMSIITEMDTIPSIELITSAPPDSLWSGVSVKDEEFDTRRVHFSAWEAEHYTQDGWKFFYRILFWQLGGEMPDAGTPISDMEDFEGDAPGTDPVTLWDDDLNDPSMPNDTTIIYYENFENPLGPEWNLFSLSPQGRIQLAGGFLEMDRDSYSALNPTRNLARVSVDLSLFDENSDDLVLMVETQKGLSETIDVNDGIFFTSANVALDTLYTEDFTVFPLAPGDVTFDHTNRGRHRVHSPGWGGDGAFVTLDVDLNGNYSYNRMMIELLTVHDPGALITVSYDFSDHGDESNTADFIGWNSHGLITGAYNLLENLIPASYTNGVWTNRTSSFTQTVASGAPLYVVFGQYDNYVATSATASDGISFDNIEITSLVADTTYDRFAIPSSSAGWRSLIVDLDQAARDNSYPFDADYQMTLSQFGNGSWNSYGMQWDNFTIGKIETEFTVAGWSHGIVMGGYVDDWAVSEIFPGNYAWTLWGNNPNFYSPDCFCWLQTPTITIPGGATDVELSFQHQFNFEVGNDGGMVMISVDGGAWNVFAGMPYNGAATAANPIPDGTPIFTGIQGPVVETIDLTAYAGSTVAFRFVAASDGSIENEGWILDDFHIEGLITGYAITAVQFEAENTIPLWTLNYDLYLQSTTDASLASGAEWAVGTMVHSIAGGSLDVSGPGYYTLVLDSPFILPVGENLMVKIVQDNAGWTNQMFWRAGMHNSPFLCRGEHSDDPAPIPTDLTVIEERPTIRLLTDSDPIIIEDGASNVDIAPFDTYYMNNNFEAIYLATEMQGGTAWSSGGTQNDWEIGAPIFTPDIDPALLPGNGNNVAGTDLTNDGYYNSDAWCWLRSSAYEMPVVLNDTTVVRFDRCIRLSANDFAHLQVAFTDTADPPDPADWLNARTYMVNQSIWELEEVILKDEFDAAYGAGKLYYWIRFVLDSGPFGEKGGWNVDNIQFYGRDI